ncbi:MAG: methionine--tRNA ligase [Planctomycetota bacterium]|nr:methionine--tRNA ligase [Planctomycetota bacterium]
MSQRQILVTSALPYANGHIHIGHLVEYIQTDIFVRFQKLRGHNCRYFCADDTHGTAIMIRAKAEGRSEEHLIAEMSGAHQRDFAAFGIEFDHYGSTNSASNRAVCDSIWASLRKQNLIVERSVERLFDPEAGTFLADRFVKGTCPKCQSPEQYGDSCEKCNATYAPTDLIDARSTLSGATPEPRMSQQLFVQIEQLHEFLTSWTQAGGHLQDEVANYLKGHFLGEPLRDWDVSRPAPYFGFEIPDAPGNYWYVWFDAPIGYIASCHDWCQASGEDSATWWPRGPEAEQAPCEIRHFIGKDIIYFHTLFWPAMLKASGFKLPDQVHIHGFLTVDGEKMSKSRGTFVQAATYAKHLDPSYLRYFYASKLGGRVDDIDLNLDEFKAKVDSDLVGKVVNLASRTAKMAKASGLAASYPDDGGLFAAAAAQAETIAAAYEATNYAEAMRRIMALADRANEYVETAAPWSLKKDPARADELQAVCTVALNLFRQLVVFLTPVLPRLADQAGALLGNPITTWNQAQQPLIGTEVAAFKHLMQRVDEKKVQAMIDESKDAAAETAEAVDANSASTSPELDAEPLAAECSFDDFSKVDLRVAEIVSAEHVEGADKLLCLKLSLGGSVTKQVFAGIKSAYAPEDLVGRHVVCVANLAPRKMKFGMSEGMVIAAGPGKKDIFLLSPDAGAKPGQRVH